MNIVTEIYPEIRGTNRIEDILCLATLVANGVLDGHATVQDATEYFEVKTGEDCSSCPLFSNCLACSINE